MESWLLQCIRLRSDFVKLHHETNILSILYKNSYAGDVVGKCIKEFLNRVLTSKIVLSRLPKNDLMKVVPYLGKLLLQICTRIKSPNFRCLFCFQFW